MTFESEAEQISSEIFEKKSYIIMQKKLEGKKDEDTAVLKKFQTFSVKTTMEEKSWQKIQFQNKTKKLISKNHLHVVSMPEIHVQFLMSN